jgi:eukaryotic-like serine/threonine-protein kinase
MNCPACDHENVDGARYCAKCGALMPVAHVAGDDPLIGNIVGGRYRVTGLLGEGGMGRVYTAEQQMGTAVRKVAVKTLLQEFSKDPQVVARFMRECGTVVELEHPNTIKFYDFGQTDAGDLYIAMEFVDGKPLSEVIETGGALSFERVDNILKQMCGSLHEAHEKGIVHRDLKPDNVILTRRAGEDDFVKVLDFGIAKRNDAADAKQEQKLTQAGMVLGTPPYMSPEQFTGKELDLRSDIYSLGVMTYEMLTGKLPFKADTPWEWATQHMTQQPHPFEQTSTMAAQIPPHIKQACMRALSKDRDERQATAREFYADFSGGAGGRRSVTQVDTSASGGAATEAFSAPPPMMAPTGGATEAFAAPAMTAPGAGAARPGQTQVGEPFVPPMDAGPPPGAYGSPHQNVPTAGGQAVPAPPARSHGGGGGGGKGLYIVLAGLVAAGLVVGGIVMFSGGGGDEDGDTTVIDIGKPGGNDGPKPGDDGDDTTTGDDATTGDDPTGGDTGEGGTGTTPPEPPPPQPKIQPTAQPKTQPTTQPTSQPPPPPPPDGTAACDAAIGAALAGNCSAARANLAKCSGHKKHIATANVNQKCRGR